MIATKEYYEDLVHNLMDALENVAEELLSRSNEEEIEDFIDDISHVVIEFGGEWDSDEGE